MTMHTRQTRRNARHCTVRRSQPKHTRCRAERHSAARHFKTALSGFALQILLGSLLCGDMNAQTDAPLDDISPGEPENASQWPIGFPTAEGTIPNAVPLEDIRRIAAFEARRTWGEISSICEIPCCDQNGNIVAYQVVFRIHSSTESDRRGTNSDQSATDVSYAAIQSKIREARKQYPSVERNFRIARGEMSKTITDAERQHDEHRQQKNGTRNENPEQPEVVNIPVTETFKDAYAKMESLRNTMTGAGQYGTVLVTARYDLIPVPVVEHGLPPFYARGDLMQKKAEDSMGGSPMLKRIYLAGPLDQWYEFSNAQSENILVDPANGKTYPQAEIHSLMKDGILMRGKPDSNARKWEALKKAAKEDQQ